ncbi:MAG: four helix bundle protein [Chloroflexi bacterium]|nr:four helix bundle protein [Chloroflexota bacterium]
MEYDVWERTVPRSITGDALWKMKVYRLAMFVGELGWLDVTKLIQDQRTVKLAGQLYEALGSVSANIAEGYSKSSGKDRARFYEYALGSARESRDWYYKARHVLGETIAYERMEWLSQIIRLALTILPEERERTIREESAPYATD